MQQPDKEILMQWCAGDLEGDQLANVEKWADENPALAASMVNEMMEPIAGLELLETPQEVPYPEFFNSKIEQQIFAENQHSEEKQVAVTTARPASIMQKLRWLLAPAALAAMVACFYVGTYFGPQNSAAIVAKVEKHIIYVTNESVEVEVIESEGASVIEVEGLEPFSDDDITVSSYITPESNDQTRLILARNIEQTWF